MKFLLKEVNNANVNTYAPLNGELLVNTDSNGLIAGAGGVAGGKTLNAAPSFVVDIPVIATPVEADTVNIADLTITTSPFSGSGIHVGTLYEIATDAGFTNIVYSYYSTTDLLQHNPFANGFDSDVDILHYLRVKHNSSAAGYSDYSSVVTFTITMALPVVEKYKMYASDFGADDNYGVGVAINNDGSILAVGAHGYDSGAGANAGAVYIYEREANGTYTEVQKVFSSDLAAGDRFGVDVGLSADGTVLVVGAYIDNNANGTNAGAVYVFNKDAAGNFIQSQKLVPTELTSYDEFGISLDISGDKRFIVAGADGTDTAQGSNAGAAYVYKWDGGANEYVKIQKLLPSIGGVNSNFGLGVSLSEDSTRLYVSSYRYATVDGAAAGKMFAFDFNSSINGYAEVRHFNSTVGTTSNYYGIGSGLSGDGLLLAVGSGGDDAYGYTDIGLVELYKLNADGTETFLRKLWPINKVGSLGFGRNIAISHDRSLMVVGAQNDDTKGNNAGTVYVFETQ